MISIILPVSRVKFLKEVFDSLEALNCDVDNTNLFVYVDGDLKLFERAREFVRLSKFKEKLCVYRKKGLPNVSHMSSRRKRIGDIHREITTYLDEGEFVFLLEDDTLIPPNTLEVLMEDMLSKPNVGFVSGIELGRWGFAHIGAWNVDKVQDPSIITSIEDSSFVDIESVDAAGFYCCLTRKVNYMDGDFIPFDRILGPDFSYGLDLKRRGFSNYIDRRIKCVHKTPKDDVTFDNSKVIRVRFTKDSTSRNGWRLTKL